MSNCHGDEMTARPRPSISAMRKCDKGRLREICRPRLPCHGVPGLRSGVFSGHGMEATRVPFRLPKPGRNEDKKGEAICPSTAMSYAGRKLVMLSVGREES